MKKLTKHTNFNDLKADTNSAKSTLLKRKRTFSEFETFLNQLRHEFTTKKKVTTTYGKKSK